MSQSWDFSPREVGDESTRTLAPPARPVRRAKSKGEGKRKEGPGWDHGGGIEAQSSSKKSLEACVCVCLVAVRAEDKWELYKRMGCDLWSFYGENF